MRRMTSDRVWPVLLCAISVGVLAPAVSAQSAAGDAGPFDCDRVGNLWEDATKEELRDPTLHLRSTKLYFSQQLYQRAAREAELAVHLDPTVPEYFMRLGMAYAQLKCYAAAGHAFATGDSIAKTDEKKFKDILADIENNRAYYWTDRFNAGVDKNAEEEYDAAIECFQDAIAIDPNEPKAYRNLGVVYGALQKNETALSMFESALEREPENETTRELYRRAKAAVANDRYTEGREAGEGSPEVAVEKMEEALSLFSDAVAMEPPQDELVDYHANRAIILQTLGDLLQEDTARSHEYYEKAIQEYRLNAVARHAVMEANGETPPALDADDQYLRNVLVCFLSTEKYDSTLVYGKKLIDLDPRVDVGYGLVASALQNQGDADAALTYFLMRQCLSERDGQQVQDINQHIMGLLNRYQPADDIVTDSIKNLESPEDVRMASREGGETSEAWVWWSKGFANCYYNGQFIGKVEFKPTTVEP